MDQNALSITTKNKKNSNAAPEEPVGRGLAIHSAVGGEHALAAVGAGAALLEEGKSTAERLREPRLLVSRANRLVAEQQFSEALSHYYDALDM